jgi:hypothetical protein
MLSYFQSIVIMKYLNSILAPTKKNATHKKGCSLNEGHSFFLVHPQKKYLTLKSEKKTHLKPLERKIVLSHEKKIKQLKPNCSTFKSDLSGTTECDQNTTFAMMNLVTLCCAN